MAAAEGPIASKAKSMSPPDAVSCILVRSLSGHSAAPAPAARLDTLTARRLCARRHLNACPLPSSRLCLQVDHLNGRTLISVFEGLKKGQDDAMVEKVGSWPIRLEGGRGCCCSGTAREALRHPANRQVLRLRANGRACSLLQDW